MPGVRQTLTPFRFWSGSLICPSKVPFFSNGLSYQILLKLKGTLLSFYIHLLSNQIYGIYVYVGPLECPNL